MPEENVLTPEEREARRAAKEAQENALMVHNIRDNVTLALNRLDAALQQYAALERRTTVANLVLSDSSIDATTLVNGVGNLRTWINTAKGTTGELAYFWDTFEKVANASSRGVK